MVTIKIMIIMIVGDHDDDIDDDNHDNNNNINNDVKNTNESARFLYEPIPQNSKSREE